MKFVIRIKDGKPFEHPIFIDNFREAFPDIDLHNLPPEFAIFERVARPTIGVYEVYEGVTYEWFDNVVKDVHQVRLMTEEEKTAKQNAVKKTWEQHVYKSWIFNTETCSYQSPIPMPEDAGTGDPPKIYSWDESTGSWVIVEMEIENGN